MFDGRAWLDVFETSLRDELAVVDVEPMNPRSAPVSWIDMGSGLVLTVGFGQHARWELDLDQDDLEFLHSVTRAAIDGRVSSAISKHDDEVRVVHADGRVESAAGSDAWGSLLSLLWWRRPAKRRVQYEPYGRALSP